MQCLLQKAGGLLFAEKVGEGAGRPIASDLVVLDALGCGDEGGIANTLIQVFIKELVSLFDQAIHAFAFFTFGLFAESLKNSFQTFRVSAGLLQVVLKSLA